MTIESADRSWVFPVLRAIPAAIVALVITFTADHSTSLGFISLASVAASSGAILIVGALRGAYPRRSFLALGGLLVAGSVVALVLKDSGVASMLFLISALFAVTGILELAAGVLARATAPAARDWTFVGAISAVFALAMLVVPADFSHEISVEGKEVPPLTASVIAVGSLGAYCAIVAVYLVISGLSLKWAADPTTVGSTTHG